MNGQRESLGDWKMQVHLKNSCEIGVHVIRYTRALNEIFALLQFGAQRNTI